MRFPDFQNCFKSAEQVRVVDEDAALARRLGISSTPVSLIGVINTEGSFVARRWVMGAKPYTTLRTILEEVAQQSSR
jgi:predicted DsbA family dithiol-disulfide isomerase